MKQKFSVEAFWKKVKHVAKQRAVGHLCKFITVLRFAKTRCSKTSENYCN